MQEETEIETTLAGKQAPREAYARFRRYLCVTLSIVVVAAVALRGGPMLGRFIERHFMFFPSESLVATPTDAGMQFEDVYFSTGDGARLNAWLISTGKDAPMVLWFHGNAGNISDRLQNARLLYDRGLSLFMVDYRGYGKSEGKPSEKGINDDGQAAYDYLISRGVETKNLIVFGRSLGSTVAIFVAIRNECAGVILESAFTNMADMAKEHYPIIPGTGGFKLKFPSIDRVGSVEEPILFIHGDYDDIVPYALGRRLFEATTAEKDFYTINGAGHNDTYIVGGQEYFDRFEKFVREKTGKERPSASR